MKQNLSLLGVPMDLGQNRRGVDMGPSAMRYAGAVERLEAIGYNVEDLGELRVEKDRIKTESTSNLKHLPEVAAISQSLAEYVKDILSRSHFPLILGGDHSISIGTLAGASSQFKNMGVIWYDAHGDLNTAETSPSGNIHGMPLAVGLGHGHPKLTSIGGDEPKINPEHVVIIGARALDEGEKEYIEKTGMKVLTMHEVDRRGMASVMQEAIDTLSTTCDGVHLSLDLDGLDPIDAPGVGTPVVGGLSYRESHLAMEMLAEADILTSAEFVEVNPILDEKNKTAEAAVALIGSLFGEKLK